MATSKKTTKMPSKAQAAKAKMADKRLDTKAMKSGKRSY